MTPPILTPEASSAQAPLGQSAFRDPLLIVLGEISDWRTNRVTLFRDTHDPVCKKMGITIDQHGFQDASGKAWVELWIGWAFRDLVAAGYAARKKRGQWQLTQAGVDQAMRLRGAEPVMPDPEPVPLIIPQSTTTLPEGLLSYQPPASVPMDYAGGDLYLTSLAIQQTPCFGISYGEAPLCQSCPVQELCEKAFLGSLLTTAKNIFEEEAKAVLAAKEKERIAAAKVAQAAQAVQAAPGAAKPVTPVVNPAVPANVIPPLGNVNLVTVPKDGTLCSKCNLALVRGSSAYWSRTPPGMYHVECYEELAGIP